MGHTSKFTFPLPGRRTKPVPAPSPPATTPRTKAQKILGTGEINTEPSMLSSGAKWGWETRSNSGISISVSETTASHTEVGETGLGIAAESDVLGSPALRERRWEDESEIIPRALNSLGLQALPTHDTVTDASSLRRKQSSSTITSYYDKSKLPLSISQQTSSSAMAKGLPNKAQAILDIQGTLTEPKERSKKKKPAMLDLSALLPRPKSAPKSAAKSASESASKTASKFLRPETYRGLVLGPDMVTKSPSIMSASPDATPPPIMQRAERTIRKKLTKESLKAVSPGSEVVLNPRVAPAEAQREPVRHHPTKSTVDLLNLYDHYEQRSFADVMDQDLVPSPDSEQQALTYPAKRPTSPAPMPLANGPSPSCLISPADNASVSSRHTRTSKASKTTDRSLTNFDLQQNSMLSLSSDSEDDGYEPSSKSSLAPPALSDGQASPTSPRSAISQRSTAAAPQENNRGKLPKRASFASQPQFLPIPEGSAATNPPRLTARTSSLSPVAPVKQQQATTLIHQTSRLSIGTTSTARTASTIQPARPGDAARATSPSMLNKDSPAHQPSWPATNTTRFDDFPSPPIHRSQRSITPRSVEEPTPPLSPTSVDFYLQSPPGSRVAFDMDNRSTYSGKSLGSVKGIMRTNSVSSQNDNNSGRFMAVTRQEEMLLAALRMKRARMREDIIAEFEENMGREEEEDLQRDVTNDSGSGVSRQSSMSTMRTVEVASFGALSARPRHNSIRTSPGASKGVIREQILVMMDRSSVQGAGIETAEPSPDLDGFLGFDDDGMEYPMRRGSKTSSKGSADSTSGGSNRSRKTSLSAATSRARSKDDLYSRRDMEQTGRPRRGSDKEIPGSIREEEEEDVPRPDSPVSPQDFPVPMAMTRKKQVRLSAVGNFKPNIEAGWWDDSG